jgi:uncharacterized protein YdeI (YjbR/CyaY-like superfamily)
VFFWSNNRSMTTTEKPPLVASRERVEVTSLAQWRTWLKRHHHQTSSIWLVTYKKAVGKRYVPYDDVLDEALCFGWIDSLRRKLDEERSMLLLSPRRKGSAWSKVNREKALRLIAAGRLQPAGLAKINQAQQDGTWEALQAVDALEVPDDLSRALAANPAALGFFTAFPKSSRRSILEWIASAKRPETRVARVLLTVQMAARNLKANFPEGRNHGPAA